MPTEPFDKLIRKPSEHADDAEPKQPYVRTFTAPGGKTKRVVPKQPAQSIDTETPAPTTPSKRGE